MKVQDVPTQGGPGLTWQLQETHLWLSEKELSAPWEWDRQQHVTPVSLMTLWVRKDSQLHSPSRKKQRLRELGGHSRSHDKGNNVSRIQFKPSPLMCLHLLSMSTRAATLTTYSGDCSGQSPGKYVSLKVCTACGRFPGNSFCQASSWILEVCSATACRTMELREKYHLSPSHVSQGVAFGESLSGGMLVSKGCRKEPRKSEGLVLYSEIPKIV